MPMQFRASSCPIRLTADAAPDRPPVDRIGRGETEQHNNLHRNSSRAKTDKGAFSAAEVFRNAPDDSPALFNFRHRAGLVFPLLGLDRVDGVAVVLARAHLSEPVAAIQAESPSQL